MNLDFFRLRRKRSPISLKFYTNYLPKYTPEESARKAKRNLLLCLLAMIFVVSYEARIDGASAWGIRFQAEDVPIEYAIIALTFLFLLKWLQPIVVDFRSFQLDWIDLRNRMRDDLNSENDTVMSRMLDGEIKDMTTKAKLRLAESPDADDAAGRKKQVAARRFQSAAKRQARISSTFRMRRLAYYYELVVAHVLPVSSIILCPLIWWMTKEDVHDFIVVDGNTFYYGDHKVRIMNIDTPEPSRYGKAECPAEAMLGDRASAFTKNIITTREIEIEWSGKNDQYERALVKVRVGELYLGDMLIDAGLAKPWKGRQFDWCS